MIDLIKKLFTIKKSLTVEEKYLAQSGSLEELERRQRLIQRGKAPFQNFGGTF